MKKKFLYSLVFLFATVFSITSISFYKDRVKAKDLLLGIINPYSRLFNILAPEGEVSGVSGGAGTFTDYKGIFTFENSSFVVSPGEEFWAKLFIDTCSGNLGCADVSAAGVELHYDPRYLEVIDAQGNPATSVIIGDYESGQKVFPSWAENIVDSTNGVIRVSGFMADLQSGQQGIPFNGRGVFISVRFRALISGGSTQVTFDYIPFSDTANKGNDGSNILWSGAFSEDILDLGDTPNPTALTVNVGGSLSLIRVGNSNPIKVGDEFDVDIKLDSGGVSTVATDAVVDFPSNILEVVDANPEVSGVQITHGAIYDGYEYLSGGVDNINGVIDLTGFTTTGTESLDDVTFATIKFRAIGSGTASINFRFTPGLKNESNILEHQPGVEILEANDVLAGVTNLNVEILALQPTATSTPTPTTEPIPTPTPTFVPTPTPTLIPTPTPTPTPTPVLTPRRGDLNNDYCVNGSDVSIMVFHWGYVSIDSGSLADLDKNGKVNGADIAILVSYWGGFGCSQ